MNVPFFNYQHIFKSNQEKFIEIIKDVGERGAYILQKDLEEFDCGFSAKDNLQRLKKQRAEIKYTREVRYQMLESYHEPDAMDVELERLDKLIDLAIDDALHDINFDETFT